ncbi:MAG: chitin deacetylase [Acidobacteria bacterium]|nr:chitin deacetylase [Acidobacteriota bacterium]
MAPAVMAGQARKARIAITLDLEMSRNFPLWENTHWDYEKGNLDEAAKRYSVAVARRVAAAGGRMHFFLVGRVLEHESVEWLKEIVGMGHAIGNHTYDHVYVLARKAEEIQFRFQRAPWLMRGRGVAEVLEENIAVTTEAMKRRLGVSPAGFRTPGGFADGLAGRGDVQEMLKRQGFGWVSAKYPRHPLDGDPRAVLAEALRAAQPFRYPETGLLEIPMSPVSDINAFRTGRWPLDRFVRTTRAAVEWAIENRSVFDFLAHPSCLGVVDPQFRTVDAILELVKEAGGGAELVDLSSVATV